MAGPLPIVALFDGRPGHDSQVRGLLACLPQNPEVCEVRLDPEAPPSERQLLFWALAVRHLKSKPPSGLLEDLLGDRYAAVVAHRPQLLIAAGTRAGLYSYCLGRMLWIPTVQAMTHSILKATFSLNVIPAHDRPAPAANVVVVGTAPNPYLPEVAAIAAETFAAAHGLDATRPSWSVIIGGPVAGAEASSQDPAVLCEAIGQLLERAANADVQVLLSTSRRTPAAIADRVPILARESASVTYWQDYRVDPGRTAGALLGMASEVFLTPDSISMVSEALWAGRGVTLLPVAGGAEGGATVPRGKHGRFLRPLLANGQVQWLGPTWQPQARTSDQGYRHPDFLAIRRALEQLLEL